MLLCGLVWVASLLLFILPGPSAIWVACVVGLWPAPGSFITVCSVRPPRGGSIFTWVVTPGLSCKVSRAHAVQILTLQCVGINEVDGAGDTDADAHLTHVPQTLRQPRWKAHHVVLATRQTKTRWGQTEKKLKNFRMCSKVETAYNHSVSVEKTDLLDSWFHWLKIHGMIHHPSMQWPKSTRCCLLLNGIKQHLK